MRTPPSVPFTPVDGRSTDPAIRAFTEERQATRELIREGLRQIEAGAPSIPADAIEGWFSSDARPFPGGGDFTRE